MPPSSVWIQWSSTRPCPSRLRFCVLAPSGSSLTCCVEMLCSQVCRSAPVSVSADDASDRPARRRFRLRVVRPAGRRNARSRRRRARYRGREQRTHTNSTGVRREVFFRGDPSPASGWCPQRPASPRLRSPLGFWSMTGQPGVVVTLDGEVHPPGDATAVRRRPCRGTRRRRIRDIAGPCRRRVPGGGASGPAEPLGQTAGSAGAGPGGLATCDRPGSAAVGGGHRRRGCDALGLQPRPGTRLGAHRLRDGQSDRRPDSRRPSRRGGRADVAPGTARHGCRGDAVAVGRRQDAVVCHQHGRSAARRPAGRR